MATNRVPSIQEQLERLRNEEKHWRDVDRPRLLKMMFNPENQELMKNSSLSQILDKMQEIWNPSEGSEASERSLDPKNVELSIEDIQLEILNRDPEELINKPFEDIIKNFRTLLRRE